MRSIKEYLRNNPRSFARILVGFSCCLILLLYFGNILSSVMVYWKDGGNKLVNFGPFPYFAAIGIAALFLAFSSVITSDYSHFFSDNICTNEILIEKFAGTLFFSGGFVLAASILAIIFYGIAQMYLYT